MNISTGRNPRVPAGRDCQVVPRKHGSLRFRMILKCRRLLNGMPPFVVVMEEGRYGLCRLRVWIWRWLWAYRRYSLRHRGMARLSWFWVQKVKGQGHRVIISNSLHICGTDGSTISCAGGRYNMPRPLQVDLWPFDIETGVRATCDVGYLFANFSLHRLFST